MNFIRIWSEFPFSLKKFCSHRWRISIQHPQPLTITNSSEWQSFCDFSVIKIHQTNNNLIHSKNHNTQNAKERTQIAIDCQCVIKIGTHPTMVLKAYTHSHTNSSNIWTITVNNWILLSLGWWYRCRAFCSSRKQLLFHHLIRYNIVYVCLPMNTNWNYMKHGMASLWKREKKFLFKCGDDDDVNSDFSLLFSCCLVLHCSHIFAYLNESQSTKE